MVALLVGAQLGKDPTEVKKAAASQMGTRSVAQPRLNTVARAGLTPDPPADPSAPPGPLTHLSLPDSSEARPQSGADGQSLPGNWTR